MPKGIKDEVLLATILKQLVEAIDYFHQKSLVHRDIRAGNILVHESGRINLSNFTLTTSLKPNERLISFEGSPYHMSPERIEQKEGYDFKADIWSLGITILHLCQGEVPYAELQPKEALISIFNSKAPTLNKYEPWSSEFKSLVSDCLKKNPDERISSSEIINRHSKFFAKAQTDECIKEYLLKYLPPLD